MADKQDDTADSSDSKRDFDDLRRAVIATFSSSLARSVARVLLIIFVVDLYGIGSFGYLGEVAASVELLAAIASLGMPKTIMAYFDRHKFDAKNSANLVANALCLTAVMAVLLSIILFLLWPYIFPAASNVPAYAAAAIILIAITEMMLTLTRSRRIIKWESIVKGLVKPWGFFILAMAGYFVAVKEYDAQPIIVLIAAYFLSLIISAFTAFLGLWQLIKSQQITIGNPHLGSMAALGKESAPIAIVDAGSFASRRLDIIILGLFTGSNVTGIYYLGQQLATVIEKMRYLFEPMAAPILAQTKSTQTIGQYLKKTCRWVFAASLGAAICFTLYAVPLMELFNIYYAAAIMLMSILLLGEVIDGSSGLIDLPIIFRNPLIASRNMVITLIVETICVIIGILYFGIMGAALGFTIGMITLSALRLYSAKKLYNMRIVDSSYIKPIIAAIIAVAISWWVRDFLTSFEIFGLIVGIGICAAIYLIALRLMGISMKISDNS